jgi:predicted N-acetyltransferase YhbS
MITIDTETPGDFRARETVLDAAMGAERFLKPSQLLRDGRLPAAGLALVARRDRLVVGTVRLWHVRAGDRPALLLGPLAVAPDRQGEGVGSRLIRSALNRAAADGHCSVILVGDAPYYGRFGFTAALTRGLIMPGPVDPARLLGLELREGALAGASGPVVASGLTILPAVVPGIDTIRTPRGVARVGEG